MSQKGNGPLGQVHQKVRSTGKGKSPWDLIRQSSWRGGIRNTAEVDSEEKEPESAGSHLGSADKIRE